MKVFVTDADSGFAQALLTALCAHQAVESVTGVGGRLPRFAHPRFRSLQSD